MQSLVYLRGLREGVIKLARCHPCLRNERPGEVFDALSVTGSQRKAGSAFPSGAWLRFCTLPKH